MPYIRKDNNTITNKLVYVSGPPGSEGESGPQGPQGPVGSGSDFNSANITVSTDGTLGVGALDNPNLLKACVVTLTSSAVRTIHGMLSDTTVGNMNPIKEIRNGNAPGGSDFILIHNSGSAASSKDRFTINEGSTYTIRPGQSATFTGYDYSAQRWLKSSDTEALLFTRLTSGLASRSGAVDGEVVQTVGHTSANDGGGSTFRFALGVSAGNDGYRKINTSNGQWQSIDDGPLKPEQFGAVGDGIDDDTTALSAMVGLLSAANSHVRFGEGKTYRITNGVAINLAAQRLIFDGAESSILMDSPSQFAAFGLTAIGSFEISGVRFKSTKSDTSLLDLGVYCVSNSVGVVQVHDCTFDRVALQINDGTADRTPLITAVTIHDNVFIGDGTGLLANDTSNLIDVRGAQNLSIQDNQFLVDKFSTLVKTSGSCTNVNISHNSIDSEGIGYPVLSLFADTHKLVVDGNTGYLDGTWTVFATEKNGDTPEIPGVISEPRDIAITSNVIVADMGDWDFEFAGFFGSWGLTGATAGLKSPIVLDGNVCRGLGLTRVYARVRGMTHALVSNNQFINQTTGQFQCTLDVSNCETAIIKGNYVDGTVLCDGYSSHPGATYYANSPVDLSVQGNTIKNYGSNGALFVYHCASLSRLSFSGNTCVASASYSPAWALRFQGESGHATVVSEFICCGNSIDKGSGTLYFGIADAFTMVSKYVFADNSWGAEQRVFASGDASPSINKYPEWLTANASSTTITAFDDTERGDQWLLRIGDSNTTLDCTGTNLVNANGASDIPAASGDVYRCTNIDGTKVFIEKMAARAAVDISSEGSYTPTITAAAGTPSLGDGAIVGRYRRDGSWLHVQAELTLGSTTDIGTSVTRISLPVAASASLWQSGIAAIYDDSAAKWYSAPVTIVPGVAYVTFPFDTNQVSGSHPFSWAQSDKLFFSITYLAA